MISEIWIKAGGPVEDVRPEKISLSSKACAMARQLRAKREVENSFVLRLYIEGKGCDGFYYGVAFGERLDSDHVFVTEGVELAVDSETLHYVMGATIDWVDDERGRGFLVNNPQHKKYRGKFFRRKGWLPKSEKL